MKIIPINLYGYWHLQNKELLPDSSGVYCVYEERHNPFNHTSEIMRLLYIGGAGNIRGNIKIHLAYDNWLANIAPEHELCFSVGYVDTENYQIAKNALIFEHKPPLNEDEFHLFPFSDTTISLSGRTYLLRKRFVVCQLDSSQLMLDSMIEKDSYSEEILYYSNRKEG